MRIGFSIPKHPDPQLWARSVREHGLTAAFCPVDTTADDGTVRAFAAAANQHDIVIAEVGAWSNPIAPDEQIRRKAVEKCIACLDLAERIGARCCVNITGSRGPVWDGPHPDNLTDETFDLVVQSVRHIIDAVKPKRADYTLETMPWMFPHTPDSYLRLLGAIDRPRMAVHLDPVNLISSVDAYFNNARLIRDCFEKLGPHIRSCHAKDIKIQDKLTLHLDECCPGDGHLDYRAYLTELSRLHPDTPLMLEHLNTLEDYQRGLRHIRSVASSLNLSI